MTTTATPRSRMAQGGSFHNRMDEIGVVGQPEPVAGMGATELFYSDRKAATVAVVENDSKGFAKRIGIVRDNAIRTDSYGMSDCQSYRYEPGDGGTIFYTKRKTGQWIREGDPMRGGRVLKIGVRDHHHDYSF